eukprot:3346039-Prymnesium_polylepis.1
MTAWHSLLARLEPWSVTTRRGAPWRLTRCSMNRSSTCSEVGSLLTGMASTQRENESTKTTSLEAPVPFSLS